MIDYLIDNLPKIKDVLENKLTNKSNYLFDIGDNFELKIFNLNDAYQIKLQEDNIIYYCLYILKSTIDMECTEIHHNIIYYISKSTDVKIYVRQSSDVQPLVLNSLNEEICFQQSLILESSVVNKLDIIRKCQERNPPSFALRLIQHDTNEEHWKKAIEFIINFEG